MIKTLAIPRILRLPKVVDLFTPLLFLYFVTLHADWLNIQLAGTVRFNNLLAMAMLFVWMLRLRFDFFRLEKWVIVSVLTILASVFLSLLFTPHSRRCILHMFWLCWTLLCYFWLPYQLMKKADQRLLLKLYFASFLMVGFYAICQLVTGPLGDPYVSQFIKPYIGRPSALCYETSYYVLYMTPFVFHQTVLYLGRDSSVSGRRLSLIYFLYLCTVSAGALMSFFVFFPIVLLYRRFRVRALILILKLGIALSLLVLLGGGTIKNFLLKKSDSGSHHSVSERMANAEYCLTLFKQRPLLGYGLGGVAPERMEQGMLLDKFQGLGITDCKYAEPSNIATEILSSLGIVGVFAFSLMICLYIVQHFKMRKSLQHDAFFVSVLVMLVTWQFSQSLMRTYCWTHFAIAAAFLRTTPLFGLSQQPEASSQTQDRAA